MRKVEICKLIVASVFLFLIPEIQTVAAPPYPQQQHNGNPQPQAVPAPVLDARPPTEGQVTWYDIANKITPEREKAIEDLSNGKTPAEQRQKERELMELIGPADGAKLPDGLEKELDEQFDAIRGGQKPNGADPKDQIHKKLGTGDQRLSGKSLEELYKKMANAKTDQEREMYAKQIADTIGFDGLKKNGCTTADGCRQFAQKMPCSEADRPILEKACCQKMNCKPLPQPPPAPPQGEVTPGPKPCQPGSPNCQPQQPPPPHPPGRPEVEIQGEINHPPKPPHPEPDPEIEAMKTQIRAILEKHPEPLPPREPPPPPFERGGGGSGGGAPAPRGGGFGGLPPVSVGYQREPEMDPMMMLRPPMPMGPMPPMMIPPTPPQPPLLQARPPMPPPGAVPPPGGQIPPPDPRMDALNNALVSNILNYNPQRQLPPSLAAQRAAAYNQRAAAFGVRPPMMALQRGRKPLPARRASLGKAAAKATVKAK